MTDQVRCPVPGCGKIIKHSKNLMRHIRWYANMKRDTSHQTYLATKKGRRGLPPRPEPSPTHKGETGPAPPPGSEGQAPSGAAPSEMMSQLPVPPKPVPRGGEPPVPAATGEASLAEKAELSGLTFGTQPPQRYDAVPAAVPYTTDGIPMGVWSDEPAPGYEAAIEFFYKLTLAFKEGKIEDLGKPKKEDYVAFAKYLRNRKGRDLDPLVVGMLTGSKIIIAMIVNMILGFMKMIEKWKEKAATKKAEAEAEALASAKVAEDAVVAAKEKPVGA